MSSYSRYGDRRPPSSSRRDGSQSSRRDRDSSRRSSPVPSRGRGSSPQTPSRPRDENELPAEFGRPTEPISKEDENTVLKRMKTAFAHSPLSIMNQCIRDNQKIKIWTRNFKEVRGICTGYVVAFDKHWNLVLSDVDEVYIKPKKAKTPFLLDVKNCEDFSELPPKVPKVKKTKPSGESAEGNPEDEAASKDTEEKAAKKSSEEETAKKSTEAEEEAKKSPDEEEEEAASEKKQKKKKKKGGRKVNKRLIKQLFIRGDNIVMCAVMDTEETSG